MNLIRKYFTTVLGLSSDVAVLAVADAIAESSAGLAAAPPGGYAALPAAMAPRRCGCGGNSAGCSSSLAPKKQCLLPSNGAAQAQTREPIAELGRHQVV